MLHKQQTCLDLDGITIKIILGNLIEEKTVCKDTFTNIFSYQVTLVFSKISMLLALIGPILGHPLSVKITGFIPFRQKHLWDLMLKMVTELLPYIVIVQLFLFLVLDGFFQDYSRIIWIIVTFTLSNHQRQSSDFSGFRDEVFLWQWQTMLIQ